MATVNAIAPGTITRYIARGTTWGCAPTSAGWIPVEGLQIAFLLPPGVRAEVEITVHGHGAANDAGRRLDVGAFDNDKLFGVGGSVCDLCDFPPGMALTQTPTWTAMVAIAAYDAEPGLHVITAKARNKADNGSVNFNGGCMIVRVTTAPRVGEAIVCTVPPGAGSASTTDPR